MSDDLEDKLGRLRLFPMQAGAILFQYEWVEEDEPTHTEFDLKSNPPLQQLAVDENKPHLLVDKPDSVILYFAEDDKEYAETDAAETDTAEDELLEDDQFEDDDSDDMDIQQADGYCIFSGHYLTLNEDYSEFEDLHFMHDHVRWMQSSVFSLSLITDQCVSATSFYFQTNQLPALARAFQSLIRDGTGISRALDRSPTHPQLIYSESFGRGAHGVSTITMWAVSSGSSKRSDDNFPENIRVNINNMSWSATAVIPAQYAAKMSGVILGLYSVLHGFQLTEME